MSNLNNLFESYEDSFSDFEKQLRERSLLEIKYDKIILYELSKGKDIKSALKVASKIYPSEALTIDDNSINEISSYYEFMLNHEEIKMKSK